MQKIEKFLSKYYLVIILLLSLPAVAALAVPGFYGASDDLHIGWLSQMDKVLREGKYPPRFVPDLSFGFGYPLFNFVFPLPFYIAEIFHLTGMSLVDSIKLLFALSLPLSGILMYKLLREFVNPYLALAGAIIYIYTPYRSTDIYVRGAIGEIVSFIFLPLIILSVIKIVKKDGRVLWTGFAALSTAALVMSHNIMAYMFFPFVLLLAFLISFTSKEKLKTFFQVFSAILFGLFISVYFWLPALIESRLMRGDTVFNFVDHFPTLKQLITPHFGYGASVPGPYDGMSFFIGLAGIILVPLSVLFFAKYFKKLTKLEIVFLFWAIFVFLISIFMMNYRSTLIWEKIPFIGQFQFPWRFLSMTTFVIPLSIIVFKKFKYANILALLIMVVIVATSVDYFMPHDFLGRQDDYYLDRYIPFPKATDAYRQTGEEYLRLPLSTQMRPSEVLPRVTSNYGTVANINLINSLDARFNVVTPVETEVSYNKYNFPGWRVIVDGINTPIFSGKPYGQIVFKVGAGNHQVLMEFRETNFRMFVNIVSLLSGLLAATMILSGLGKNEQKN